MADNIADTINQAADKLIHAVEAYGPQATQLVLETGRTAAWQELVYGFVWLGLLAACITVITLSIMALAREWSVDEEPFVAGAILGGIGAIPCLIGAAVQLSTVSAWVGIHHPEIYLATKLLKL